MKPKLKLHIDIPAPCDKGWDNMVPNGLGRYCDSCEKTVIDFTGMTDDELVQFFVNAKGKPFCGRYLQTQVKRNIVYHPAPKPRLHGLFLKRIAAGLLVLQTLATDVRAQVKKPVVTEHHPHCKDRQVVEPVILEGRLSDYLSGQAIMGVAITIAGTTLSDTTDSDGRFAISLPHYLPGSIKFTAHYNYNDEPAETQIFSEDFTYADAVAGNTVNIKRYPEGAVDEVSYNAPPRMMTVGFGGNITTTGDVVIYKPTLWHRIKSTFKRR